MAEALVSPRNQKCHIYLTCRDLRYWSAAGTSHAKVPFVRVQTGDSLDVAARARELGCRVPVGVALLPGNFSTAVNAGEFCYHTATAQVRSAWQDVGLEDEGPDARDTPGENGDCTAAHPMGCSEGLSPFSRPQGLPPLSSDENGGCTQSSIGIVSQAGQADTNSESAQLPLVVFFGAGLHAGPPWHLVVALGMVSSVFASLARRTGKRDVRLDVVVERPGDRGYACIEYRGDAFGIVPLIRDVRRVWTGK